MSSTSTVFLVDDDPAVLKAFTLALRKRGYLVAGYLSAEDFLAGYSGEPGCLILDLRLSGMNGLDLQKALKEKKVDIPIIFISGHGDIPSSVKAIKAGAIDFLEKPVRRELLMTRIDEALAEDARNRDTDARHREIRARFEKLTAREREVLGLLVAESADTSSKNIANLLGISPRTIESHRARIIEKMQARSMSDLVSMARICGL
ncbi:MAG: response regulator [Woeseiaceae bacterium]|nr:response regulator [Woeseiaceae bacterium]